MYYASQLPTSPQIIRCLSGCNALRADVVFGSPRRNCAGSGICRIVAWSDLATKSTQCPQYRARLYKSQPQELLLEVPLTNMPRRQFDQLFFGPHFVVEATFRLPLSITRTLFGHRTEIAAGEYPYTICRGVLSIRFPLQNSRRATDRPVR
jgi:hypothetical protein